MLLDIRDKVALRKIADKIEELAQFPEQRGEPLVDELIGYRKIVAAGRYRVIYRVDEAAGIVRIVAAGIRREGHKNDIYKLAARMFAKGEF